MGDNSPLPTVPEPSTREKARDAVIEAARASVAVFRRRAQTECDRMGHGNWRDILSASEEMLTDEVSTLDAIEQEAGRKEGWG